MVLARSTSAAGSLGIGGEAAVTSDLKEKCSS
jgi:hypothetical protein